MKPSLKELTMNKRQVVLSTFCLAAACNISLAADPPEATQPDDVQSQARLKLMRDTIAAFSVRFEQQDDLPTQKFSTEPILRYSDPVRGLLDATVWRLGEDGRPRALVTLELSQRDEDHILTYEFLSLSADPFAVSGNPYVRWRPTGTDLEFQELPRAPQPAATEQARLLQLKQMARRFTAEQLYAGQNNELRLLPQPLHRYRPSDSERADGAVFAFVFGTNPEIVLFVECDGEQWTFACARLSVAVLDVLLDGEPAWHVERFTAFTWSTPYTATRHSVTLSE
jgi:hypothetical protein